MHCSKRQSIVAVLLRDHSSPFTRATISNAYGSPISSRVTIQGPNALAPSKSLPLAGPSRPAISSACASRALKSLNIV